MIDSFTGDYRFLSNFYPSIIEWCGISFPTVEHAYQAAKTMNLNQRQTIASLATPGQAKRAGRKIHLRQGWAEMRIEYMNLFLCRKFVLPGCMGELLLSTGNKKLIEGNHWGDTFWGVCRGVGENNLGKLLMTLREQLQKRRMSK